MDLNGIEIGGVSLLLLVLGLVEAAKRLGVNGNKSFVLALILGGLLTGLHQAISQGLLPDAVLPWITVIVVGLGGSLAATGLYDLSKRLLTDGQQ